MSLLNALFADADLILEQCTGDSLPPSGYSPVGITWKIVLSTSSNVASVLPLFVMDKTKRVPATLQVPNVKRTAGISPILFSDKTVYMIGFRVRDPKDSDETHLKECNKAYAAFDAYKSLVAKCIGDTNNPLLKHYYEWLATITPGELPEGIPLDILETDRFVVEVDGVLLHTVSTVKQFWARHFSRQSDSAAVSQTQCLLSGEFTEVRSVMPIAVKGLGRIGGKTEMALVSANFNSAESYGLKNSLTSPISNEAGERFGQALNALLASPQHSRYIDKVALIWWSPAGVVPLLPIDPPDDPGEVDRFVSSILSGTTTTYQGLSLSDRFSCYTITANAARVVVRDMYDGTIGDILKRQAQWFSDLAIVSPNNETPLSVRTLGMSCHRELKDASPLLIQSLVRRAIFGDPLPLTILAMAVRRTHGDNENRMTRPRAALIKCCLLDDPSYSFLRERNHSMEIEHDMPAAYHCGRLFAELEDIQQQALPGLNATIADRFFGSASTAPATVFGRLLSGSQDHLGKLRRTNSGAHYGAQTRLERIMGEIQGFPTTLSIQEQGLFSLGYYHHKMAQRIERAARKAAKEEAGNE
jgi:CRISPR-associated protein Csd1